MDPELDLEARRLYLSAALTMQAARSIGGRIDADSDAFDLLVLARNLVTQTEHIERAHHLFFEPPYPGVTAGVEAVSGGLRLLLACRGPRDEHKPPRGGFSTPLSRRPPPGSG